MASRPRGWGRLLLRTGAASATGALAATGLAADWARRRARSPAVANQIETETKTEGGARTKTEDKNRVIVVGGGVVGVCTAYHLARAGYRVKLLEADPHNLAPPCSAAYGNAGHFSNSRGLMNLASLSVLWAQLRLGSSLGVGGWRGAGEGRSASPNPQMHAKIDEDDDFRATKAFFRWRHLATDPYWWRWCAFSARALVGEALQRAADSSSLLALGTRMLRETFTDVAGTTRWEGWDAQLNADAARAVFAIVANERGLGLAESCSLAQGNTLDVRLRARTGVADGENEAPERNGSSTQSGSSILTSTECLAMEPCLADLAAGADAGAATGAGALRLAITQGLRGDSTTNGNCAAFSRRLAEILVEKYGAEIRLGAPVEKLSVDPESGAVNGVVIASNTSLTRKDNIDGAEILKADRVVLCTGWQTAALAGTAAPNSSFYDSKPYLPIHPLRGYSLTAKLPKGAAPTSRMNNTLVFSDYGLYFSRPTPSTLRAVSFGEFTSMEQSSPRWRSDGGGVSPTNEEAALFSRLQSVIAHVLPAVARDCFRYPDRDTCEIPEVEKWIGCRPQTPDSLPIVGPTQVPGLYVNAGHSSYGWKLAAHSSEVLVAALREEAEAGKEGSKTDFAADAGPSMQRYIRLYSLRRWA